MAGDLATPLPQRGETSINLIKFALYVGTIIISAIVFVFISQASQDDRIADANAKTKLVESRHEDNAKQAAETFAKIDRTLTTQQDLLTKTRESMLRLEGSQDRLVDEVKRLSVEVRRQNP